MNAQAVTPAFTLRAAATYLTRYGWVQKEFYFHPDHCGLWAVVARGDWPSACALGGIAVAAHGYVSRTPFGVELPGWPIADAARDALYDYLLSMGEIDFETSDPDPMTIEDWNDRPEQTLEAVVAVLRAAADDWDCTQGGAA